MNNNLKPIDQPPDNRKANIAEQVPVLHKQYKEKPSGTIPNSTAMASLWLRPTLEAATEGSL